MEIVVNNIMVIDTPQWREVDTPTMLSKQSYDRAKLVV